MADQGKVRFIRKGGRIIPIRQKAKIQSIEFEFKQKKTTAGGRAKEAAKTFGGMGAMFGGIAGGQFGLRGLAGGAALGGLALAGIAAPIAAAFGARKRTEMRLKSFGTNKGVVKVLPPRKKG